MLLGADNNNVIEIVNGGNNSCSEFDSSENFIDFKDVAAWWIFAFDERLHVMVDFLSSKVYVCCQKTEDITLLMLRTHSHRIKY